jgi:hypothetical protein
MSRPRYTGGATSGADVIAVPSAHSLADQPRGSRHRYSRRLIRAYRDRRWTAREPAHSLPARSRNGTAIAVQHSAPFVEFRSVSSPGPLITRASRGVDPLPAPGRPVRLVFVPGVALSRCATKQSGARNSADRSTGLRRYSVQDGGPTVGSGAADMRTIGSWANTGWHRNRLHSSAPFISGIAKSVTTKFAGSWASVRSASPARPPPRFSSHKAVRAAAASRPSGFVLE